MISTAFSLLLVLVVIKCAMMATIPLTTSAIEKPNSNNASLETVDAKSIDDLMQKQTDVIKKIVSNQQQQVQQQSRIEYPTANKYDAEDKEKYSLEELKIKCQHLSNIANENKLVAEQEPEQIVTTPQNAYIPNKIAYYHKPTKGFYVTKETPIKKPIDISNSNMGQLNNVKLIKLEPVILQKTILSDGRTIYYWHKSLPSTLHYSAIDRNDNMAQIDSQIGPSSVAPIATTAIPSSSGYDFRKFFPSFYSTGNSEQTTTTTTQKTTTTTETTPPPPPQSSVPLSHDDQLYSHQLRFVVPVPYTSPENVGVKKPWDFDQFAYYPKQYQPETVNMQVPYVPTFHIIRAIAIPNKQDINEKNNFETTIDNT